jgi:hypothetical protein
MLPTTKKVVVMLYPGFENSRRKSVTESVLEYLSGLTMIARYIAGSALNYRPANRTVFCDSVLFAH